MTDYLNLFRTRTSDRWHKIGVKRRAGVVIPLYSLYSADKSLSGDFFDLQKIADWCVKTGFSVIQLLPLNEMGDDFSPYNSLSSFALDPIYLRLTEIKNADRDFIYGRLEKIKRKYPRKFGRIDYRFKHEILSLAKQIFRNTDYKKNDDFRKFKENNSYWLHDYALFMVIREKLPFKNWEEWNITLRDRDTEIISEIENSNANEMDFYSWLQWQLYEQLRTVKNYLNERNILLKGDIPFLISRNSADVWSHRDYFRLDLAAGAPPDMYFAEGQRWGMPPYNWEAIACDDFTYITKRLQYAENFYDMFRIDHFIGLFRLWVFPYNQNTNGFFLPADERLWEYQGRIIVDKMIEATAMLPCAEDLGTVPECSFRVLHEYGIPGIEFQRYLKNNFSFKPPDQYRMNSVAVISTHDSSLWYNWWTYEAGTVDEKFFDMLCIRNNISAEHLKYLKKNLFEKPYGGRLRWRKNISGIERLRELLNVPYSAVNDFIWLYMESFDEKEKFLGYLYKSVVNNHELVKLNLLRINQSASIFAFQLIHEYLCLDEMIMRKINKRTFRINTPGITNKTNWRLTLPVAAEELETFAYNDLIREIIRDTDRLT